MVPEELIRSFARAVTAPAPQPFVPGKTLVPVAGAAVPGVTYGAEEIENLLDVAASFHLTAGKWHDKLEHDLADWYGVKYARLVNSGSSANLIAVAALMSPLLGDRALTAGDEVITVAAAFPTTVAPIIRLGLMPVFVDVTLPDYNVDVTRLGEAYSSRTRAVMLAHTLGSPFNLDAVRAFCRDRDLFLIEDNCDAAGSTYRSQKTGTFGDLATLSFYPAHHMTTGEGGAVLTNDSKLAKAVTSLRDWGRDCWCAPNKDNTCGHRFGWKLGSLPEGYDHKYCYSHLGFNLKMTDMQAAVGCAQLARLDHFCAARRENWAFYQGALADLDEILIRPTYLPAADPSPFGFLVTLHKNAPISRGDFVAALETRRIQTRPLFAGNLTRHPAMAGARYALVSPLAWTDVAANRAFWIGVAPGLTQAMKDWVVESFHEIARGR